MKLCPSCSLTITQSDWHCAACGWMAPQAGGIIVLGTVDAESGEGFSPAYFEDLSHLEAGHFWFRARNRIILWAVEKYLANAQSYMEIGCGTGFVMQALHAHRPAIKLTGSELFLEGLTFAAARMPDVELLQMDAKAIPYLDHFDGLGAFDVLEHVPNDQVVLAQFYRALRPGGRLLLTVPQHPWLWSVNDEYAHHHRRYRRAQLCSRVRQAGFSVLKTTSFVSLLLPFLFLSRMSRNARSAFDPLEEYRLAPWKQRILEQIMKVEYQFIRLGWNWPLGGSLLMIAEKPEQQPSGAALATRDHITED